MNAKLTPAGRVHVLFAEASDGCVPGVGFTHSRTESAVPAFPFNVIAAVSSKPQRALQRARAAGDVLVDLEADPQAGAVLAERVVERARGAGGLVEPGGVSGVVEGRAAGVGQVRGAVILAGAAGAGPIARPAVAAALAVNQAVVIESVVGDLSGERAERAGRGIR